MAQPLGLLCYGLAALGLVALVVQALAVARHRAGARPPPPPAWARISILKPLCGADDELAENLEAFARLPYPRAELLLGVEDRGDPAYPIAAAAAARRPGRVRVVVQRGAPGLNPKVNQLMTLAAAARGDILVVSDSNVRPAPGYLEDIAAHLADPRVGLVTHAIVGGGERSLGALLDGAHLSTSVGPGVIAAKRVAGKDIVVGKSMALRARDVAALGGFAVVKDVLAEDYVLGLLVPARLGKRVVVARDPIVQVTGSRSTAELVRRYLRWTVIHRKAVPAAAYAGELLLNPIAVAALACALAPSPAALAAVVALKVAVDAGAARLLRGHALRRAALLAVPLKDLVLAAIWIRCLFSDTVSWRGRRLRVRAGTRLAEAGEAARRRRWIGGCEKKREGVLRRPTETQSA